MTILPLQSDADPAGCAHSCDPGTAIHSMVERTRTKSTRVTKFLKKLAKDGASSRIRVKYGQQKRPIRDIARIGLPCRVHHPKMHEQLHISQ